MKNAPFMLPYFCAKEPYGQHAMSALHMQTQRSVGFKLKEPDLRPALQTPWGELWLKHLLPHHPRPLALTLSSTWLLGVDFGDQGPAGIAGSRKDRHKISLRQVETSRDSRFSQKNLEAEIPGILQQPLPSRQGRALCSLAESRRHPTCEKSERNR